MGDELDFDQALAALMDWVGRRARIEVAGPDERGGMVLAAEGVLTARWDPGVMAQNAGEEGAIFHLVDTDVSLFVMPSDFDRGWRREDGSVLLWIGGTAVGVGWVFVDPDADPVEPR